ncbi:hypothetical protein WJX73_007407 [Symbiochloris irregularis]|uniref:Purple acid phosphatase n=1 Tax=Symbiochloris irregularis TaxID=706552 RepID=A0AAW1PSP2_9CHLO
MKSALYISLSVAWLLLTWRSATIAAQAEDNRSCRPLQIHLALTGDPTEMRVMWKTKKKGCRSALQYSKHLELLMAGNGILARSDAEETYGPEDMCGSPASGFDFSHLHLHSTVLTDLDPGQVHHYRIGEDGDTHHFTAAQAPDPRGGMTFLVFGDMGESEHHRAKSPGAHYTATQLKSEVLDHNADMLLHIGDISYANGDPKIWDTFMDQIEPYAAAAPYMIGIGNHEYDYRTGKEHHHEGAGSDPSGEDKPYDPDWGNYGNDSGGECGVTVSKRFKMPGYHSGAANHHEHEANSPFWYSFEYGSVHFTIISTEHDLSHGSEQNKWLRQDLESVDRCTTPWLIVGMHRPMYVVFPHKSNRVVGRHMRGFLEELFDANEVDMVLSGHVHAYARTCNVYDERCVDSGSGGMTHVTLGCGGRKLSDVEHEQPEWLDSAAREWGYGRVQVVDGQEMLFEFVESETGEVFDSVRLENSRSRSRTCLDGELRDWLLQEAWMHDLHGAPAMHLHSIWDLAPSNLYH